MASSETTLCTLVGLGTGLETGGWFFLKMLPIYTFIIAVATVGDTACGSVRESKFDPHGSLLGELWAVRLFEGDKIWHNFAQVFNAKGAIVL